MKKISLIIVVIISSCTSVNHTQKNKIPDKREFPISENINPCEDYYDHVCSGVIKNFKLPEDRARYAFSFTDSSERILVEKKKYFKRLASKNVESIKDQRERSLKKYYNSCIDLNSVSASEKSYIQNLRDQLSKIKTKKEFITFMFENHKDGGFSMIGLEEFSNPKKPARKDLILVGNILSLPDPIYYKKEDLVKDLKSIIAEFFKNLGHAEGEKISNDVFAFESSIAEVYPDKKEIRSLMDKYVVRSKKSYIKKYKNLGLDHYLANVPTSVKLRDFMPEVLKKLDSMIAKTSLDTLKNVYTYYAYFGDVDQSQPVLAKKKYEFNAKYLGASKVRPQRNEECITHLEKRFGMEIDYYLIEQMFPNFPEERIRKLVVTIRETIVDKLKKNKWLTDSSKKEAIAKIQSATLQLVKPRNTNEWNFAKEVNYKENDFLANQNAYNKARFEKQMEEIGEPMDFTRWSMSPLTINAFYTPTSNRFVLLQGILQYPFFDKDMEDRDVIASMGMVIGHELGHSIDDNGSRFDSKGRMRKWLAKKDKETFDKLVKPLIARFNAVGHDGKQTLGENIGDMVGLNAAYKAAFPDGFSEKNREDHKKFFQSYGRIWCEVQTDSMKELRLKSDYHSLGRQRVNMQVINQPGFQKAYSCKEGDKMYLASEKMLKIW